MFVDERALPMPATAVVLTSGGVDSTAALHLVRQAGIEPTGMFVDYGQPANQAEDAASSEICSYYECERLTTVYRGPAIAKNGEIQGRNSMLLAAALMLPKLTPRTVVLGIHAGTRYRDCSLEYIDSAQQLFDAATGGIVRLFCPFAKWHKADIWDYAVDMGVPLGLTVSCEQGTTGGCGDCLSCRERAQLDVS